VLLELDDVGAVAEQEPRDGGHDAGLVGALDAEDGAGLDHGVEPSRILAGINDLARFRGVGRDRRAGELERLADPGATGGVRAPGPVSWSGARLARRGAPRLRLRQIAAIRAARGPGYLDRPPMAY
jgi:hypothetical protein